MSVISYFLDLLTTPDWNTLTHHRNDP